MGIFWTIWTEFWTELEFSQNRDDALTFSKETGKSNEPFSRKPGKCIFQAILGLFGPNIGCECEFSQNRALRQFKALMML